jgi:diguanylate cyclase (GGDEF)-like protein
LSRTRDDAHSDSALDLFQFLSDQDDRQNKDTLIRMNGIRHTPAVSKRISPSIRFIEQFLSQGSANQLTGLLLGQLDAFNRISTTFGHDQSEVFCADYAHRLRNRLPIGTPVIRLSERRFAVLLTLDSMTTIMDVAADIAEGQQPQLQVGEDAFLVDVTLGIAVYPTHAEEAASLFRRAELALKEAREHELTFEIYRPDATQQQAALWKFESELERAVNQGELEVYYQPKLTIQDNRISGVEALVRWRSQTGRLISPDEFIPLAERSGSIVDITWLVFRQVAEHAADWGELARPFSIAVNVSPQVLEHADFFPQLDRLKARMDELDLKLCLELTEDSLVEGGQGLPDRLKKIRKSGVDLSIDDFGKGYSSLTYLKDIPATEVKVDRRFISTISIDEKDRHIVKAIIGLAQAFGMEVVAEGVDSDESLRVVAELGCQVTQGFYIARPMRSELLLGWIRAYNADTFAKMLGTSSHPLLSVEA